MVFILYLSNTYLMDKDRLLVSALVLLAFTMCFIQPVSAGTSDSTSVNLTVGNSAPTISYVPAISAQDCAISGNTNISINFTANDLDGLGDLDNVTAKAALMGGLDATAVNRNASCTAASWNATAINYTCVVALWYFDPPGDWAINVTVHDSSGVMASDQSNSVTYNPTTAMDLSTNNITFGVISGGSTHGSSNAPMNILNYGNINLTTITINATDLISSSDIILASAFQMNENDSAGGTTLVNETDTAMGWANVTAGNGTLEPIYTYVTVPAGKAKEDYASRRGWTITVAA